MAKRIVIRKFPTTEGDSVVTKTADEVKEVDIFTPNTLVVMGKMVYTSWDELLVDIQESKEEEVEVQQFLKAYGG
jgi:hypothetical protein